MNFNKSLLNIKYCMFILLIILNVSVIIMSNTPFIFIIVCNVIIFHKLKSNFMVGLSLIFVFSFFGLSAENFYGFNIETAYEYFTAYMAIVMSGQMILAAEAAIKDVNDSMYLWSFDDTKRKEKQ